MLKKFEIIISDMNFFTLKLHLYEKLEKDYEIFLEEDQENLISILLATIRNVESLDDKRITTFKELQTTLSRELDFRTNMKIPLLNKAPKLETEHQKYKLELNKIDANEAQMALAETHFNIAWYNTYEILDKYKHIVGDNIVNHKQEIHNIMEYQKVKNMSMGKDAQESYIITQEEVKQEQPDIQHVKKSFVHDLGVMHILVDDGEHRWEY